MNEVSGLSLSAVVGSVILNWTNPDTFDTVTVNKSTSAMTLTSEGTLVYSGTGTTFTDTSATDYNTYYHYSVFTVLTGTPSDLVSISGRPLQPNSVTDFNLSGFVGGILLTWVNPASFTTIKVNKSTSAMSLTSEGTLVYSGTGTSFTDLSATDYNTTYHYAAYAIDYGVPSTLALTSGSSVDGDAPAGVSGFTSVAGLCSIVLTWTNPVADFASANVRKSLSAISTIADGTLVYSGTGTTFTDTSATDPAVVNYYAAYVLDAVGNASVLSFRNAVPSTAGVPNPPAGLPQAFYLPSGNQPTLWRQVQLVNEEGE